MFDVKSVIKKNKFCFFIVRKWFDKDYRSNYKNYKMMKHAKSEKQINKELELVKYYWGCDPMHYFRYRLFEKDINNDEILDYIPPYYFYNFYMPNAYKGINISLYDSKIFINGLFLKKRIKTATVLAIVKKKSILSPDYGLINYDKLIEVLHESKSTKFFFLDWSPPYMPRICGKLT